jgi:hypothetical protein
MIFDIYSLFGWIGMVLLMLAYFLLSKKKLKSNYVLYHLLNLFGATGIIASTLVTQSWPAMALNIVWAIIAIFSIYKIWSTKNPYKELRAE